MKFKTLCLGMLFSSSIFAGVATVPNWQIDGTGDMCIRMSNVADSPTEVTLRLYGTDGTLHTGGTRNWEKGSINQPFILNARESESICINYEGTVKFGYGVIETKEGAGRVNGSIIAHGLYYGKGAGNTHFGWTLPVNEGKPF